MRPEKQYLVEEVRHHLDKSDYVYLANYERITVEEMLNFVRHFGAQMLSSTWLKIQFSSGAPAQGTP
jgi:hypothetical protein